MTAGSPSPSRKQALSARTLGPSTRTLGSLSFGPLPIVGRALLIEHKPKQVFMIRYLPVRSSSSYTLRACLISACRGRSGGSGGKILDRLLVIPTVSIT